LASQPRSIAFPISEFFAGLRIHK